MTWKIPDFDAQTLSTTANRQLADRLPMSVDGAKKKSTPPLTTRIFPDHWWDEHFWTDLRLAGAYRDVVSSLKLDDLPPAKEVEAELAELMAFQASPEREERRREILEEADRPPPFYANALFLDAGRRPLTRELMGTAVNWSRMFIMTFKHQYKRPRPTQLEPRLKPMVPCPQHPAYPSGHSTQSHLLALIFGKLSGRPDVEKAMLEAADRIAANREYAGLHYRSDSAAGVTLARQLLPIFEHEFAKPITAARVAEWS